ncbi:MAG: hypothetical protein LUE29_09355 [Lachnospiraceae bacterium]|nr:hypothetical protein [Lachnospiraceae bacterium]
MNTKTKRILALLMTAVFVFSFAACGSSSDEDETTTTAAEADTTTTAAEEDDTTAVAEDDTTAADAESDVMTYAEYAAADVDTEVTIETYVQAKQAWWEDNGVGKATIYTQDEDGAYFLYELQCTEDEYNNDLTEGAHIRVTGYKSEWSGEVEITDGTFEVVDTETYVAEAMDATSLLADESLIDYQNQKVSFSGLTVEAYNEDGDAFSYAWDGSGSADANSDLYFNASIDGVTYSFVVESYLCDNTTDVYAAVEALNVGDVIDMEGFLYWYDGVNPHITSVTVQ